MNKRILSLVLVISLVLSSLIWVSAEGDGLIVPSDPAAADESPAPEPDPGEAGTGDAEDEGEEPAVPEEPSETGETEDNEDVEEDDPKADEEPVWDEFTDVSGHWAEAALKRAFEYGHLTGYGEGKMGPDEPITAAQMVTVLTRVLNASRTADASSLGISPDAWYYEAVGKALYLGIIDASEMSNPDVPMLRQDAMTMLAKAFSLVPAQPELSVLDAYSDGSSISNKNKGPMAALVSAGYVQGSDGGLMANSNITRAEFVTVLYRVAENYLDTAEEAANVTGNSVVGGGTLSELPGDVWFDCSAASATISGAKGGSVTIRSHGIESVAVEAGTELKRLVIDCGSCSFAPGVMEDVSIGTVQLASGGAMTLPDSSVKNIEITGNNQTVVIGGSHDKLVITGSGNKVTLSDGAEIGSVVLTGSGSSVTAEGRAAVKSLAVSGEKNSFAYGTGSVSAETLDVSGKENSVSVTGGLSGTFKVSGDLNRAFIESSVPVAGGTVDGYAAWINLYGVKFGAVDITGSCNTVVRDGGTLDAVNVPGNENTVVLEAGSGTGSSKISGNNNKVTVSGRVETMAVSGRSNTVEGEGLVADLTVQGKSNSITVPVTNKTDEGVTQEDIDRVKATVSYVYKGNYTTQWALDHDYSQSDKEIFVNEVHNYTSKTEYLLWVNLAMQRTNIFKRDSQGEWELIRECLVATGKYGTPVGVFTTTYKQTGWFTGSYDCRPVVRFRAGTGYAFHSRLYYPGTDRLKDPSIGFPVSAGCVRMLDEDINYIYDYVPDGTTVVVY